MSLRKTQWIEDRKTPDEQPTPMEEPPAERGNPSKIKDPPQRPQEPRKLQPRIIFIPCAQMMNVHNVNVLLERVALPLTNLN